MRAPPGQPGTPPGTVDAVDARPTTVLSWRDVGSSTWRLVRLSFRITFRRKMLFMAGGVSVYYALLYAIAVYEPDAGFSVSAALPVLVEVPGAALAIYLTMDLVARERDRQTLETLFSTASSHYVIWLVRLTSVLVVLLATLLTMSSLAYVLFAEFPFVRGALNGFIPATFFVGATFYAASYTRGANTAAMIASGLLFFVLTTVEGFEGTPYFLFLNPFEIPPGASDHFWTEKFVLNRVGVLGAACLMVFLGLRRMENREKFLS